MAPYYSLKEKVLRIAWAVAAPLFFRYSPRLFYGWRNFILRLFGAKVGSHVQIFPSAEIMYPWAFEVGDHSVISWGVKIYNLGKISIGSNTVVSQYSHLCGGTHDYASEYFNLIRSGLMIGSNVWIAADAFIGPGVSIGNGAVVAARSVVIADVASLTVVGGHPAKVIKQLTQKPPMRYHR